MHLLNCDDSQRLVVKLFCMQDWLIDSCLHGVNCSEYGGLNINPFCLLGGGHISSFAFAFTKSQGFFNKGSTSSQRN